MWNKLCDLFSSVWHFLPLRGLQIIVYRDLGKIYTDRTAVCPCSTMLHAEIANSWQCARPPLLILIVTFFVHCTCHVSLFWFNRGTLNQAEGKLVHDTDVNWAWFKHLKKSCPLQKMHIKIIILTWRGQRPCSRSCSGLGFLAFDQSKSDEPALCWWEEQCPASVFCCTPFHSLEQQGIIITQSTSPAGSDCKYSTVPCWSLETLQVTQYDLHKLHALQKQYSFNTATLYCLSYKTKSVCAYFFISIFVMELL